MNDVSNDIKQEFEDKIKSIQDSEQRKNSMILTIMNVSFVILFLAVLSGTILSYLNYKQVMDSQANLNNNSNAVELRKVK